MVTEIIRAISTIVSSKKGVNLAKGKKHRAKAKAFHVSRFMHYLYRKRVITEKILFLTFPLVSFDQTPNF